MKKEITQDILKKFVYLGEAKVYFSPPPNKVSQRINDLFGGNYSVGKEGEKPSQIQGYRKFSCSNGEHCGCGVGVGCPCLDPALKELPKMAHFGAANGVLYIL
ncbi:MAG: hypothetical protein ABIG87_00070 [Patescibacteria group bacterium]